MAYRLKNVQYKDRSCHILLQNDNGPCPLIAAANALLLRGAVSLQPAVTRANIISTDDLVHLLADWALHRTSAQQIRNSLRQVVSKESTGSVESNSDTNNERSSIRQSEEDPSKIQKQQQEFALSELIDILPSLQHGLDLNPKFTNGPDGFEYTNALSIFDILGIDLVHGWLSDPDWHDSETHALLSNRTYNQLIDLIIDGNEAKDEAESIRKEITTLRLPPPPLGEIREDKDPADKNSTPEIQDFPSETELPTNASDSSNATEKATNSNDENFIIVDCGSDQEAAIPQSVETTSLNEGKEIGTTEVSENAEEIAPQKNDDISGDAARESTTKQIQADLESETKISSSDAKIGELEKKLLATEKRIAKGKLISTFLQDTGHQLTHYGLNQLRRYIVDDTLAVFFRNNHYSTITKHGGDGHLYLLVTDLGYANADEVVWEKLDNINGDTDYVNHKFERAPPRSVLAPTAPALNPEHVLGQAGQNERDYQLAVRLSEGKAIESAALDEEEAKLIAAATAASLNEFTPADVAGSQYAGTTVAVPKNDAQMNNDTSVGKEGAVPSNTGGNSDPQHNSDLHMAMQLQAELMNTQPQPTLNEDASLALAHQLQAEEDARASQSRQVQNRRQTTRNTQQQQQPNRPTAAASSKDSSCVIS